MPYDENAKKRIMKYLKKLKEIRFRVKPDFFEVCQEAAEIAGYESMRQFYLDALQDKIDEIMKDRTYSYGMRLRGFSPGCQPKEGFLERSDDPSGQYHDIITYNRRLSAEELAEYELDYLR